MTIPPRLALPFLIALLLSCAAEDQPEPPADDAVPEAPAVPDSLALSAPGGVEVWFTDWRQARDSVGNTCIERVMEIRTAADTTPVPLLYTGVAPLLHNDSTMRARIWLNCRPGNTYDVDLRTGFPNVVNP